ncbi:MAG: hypothetical protein WBZ36_29170 [Candidatus Nitrosopolaris sp.]
MFRLSISMALANRQSTSVSQPQSRTPQQKPQQHGGGRGFGDDHYYYYYD